MTHFLLELVSETFLSVDFSVISRLLLSLFSVSLLLLCPIKSPFTLHCMNFLDQVLRLCTQLAPYVRTKTRPRTLLLPGC